MANPNRAFARIAKNPYEYVSSHHREQDARDAAAVEQVDGYQTKITIVRRRQRGLPTRFSWRVWRRQK
jgi:hypothetical protein